MRDPHLLEPLKGYKTPGRMIFFDSESETSISITDEEIERALEIKADRDNGRKPTGDVRKEHKPYLICATFYRTSKKYGTTRKERVYRPWTKEIDNPRRRYEFIRTFWREVDRFTTERQPTYMFAHNAKYDTQVMACVPELVKLGYYVKGFNDANPMILELEKVREYIDAEGLPQIAKKSITIYSSTNYFQSSLAALAKSFNMEKLDFDHDKVIDLKDPKFWDEAITYAKMDVAILETAMLSLIDFIKREKLGDFKGTIASQAFTAFRRKFMHSKIYIHNHKGALDVERRAYAGGRNEAFTIGPVPVDFLYYLDINSMYPHVMKSERFPTELVSFWQRGSVEQLDNLINHQGYLVCADCYIETDIPIFHKKADRLIFPTGKFWTSLSTPEIIEGLKRGLITHVKNIAIYKGEEIFASFVEYFYTARLEAKKKGDKVHDLLYKIIMNSLYGKTGQKKIKRSVVCHDDGTEVEVDPDIVDYDIHYVATSQRRVTETYKTFGGRIYLESIDPEDIESENSFPAIAAHVTAHARMLLFSYIEAAGLEHTHYCDTDSVFVDQHGYEKLEAMDMIDPDRLGALKIEDKIWDFNIRGCKDYKYKYKDKDGNAHQVDKTKGVSKGSTFVGLDENGHEMWASTRWNGYTTRFKEGDFSTYYNNVIIKTLRREYKKGTIGEDGRVTPFAIYDPVIEEEKILKSLELAERDPIIAKCQQIGFIAVVQKGERFYEEYKSLPRKAKGTYFRVKGGLPLDVWCNDAEMSVNELLENLSK